MPSRLETWSDTMRLPEMTDCEETCRQVRFEAPEHYNFGFDLIDRRVETSDKTACVAVELRAES